MIRNWRTSRTWVVCAVIALSLIALRSSGVLAAEESSDAALDQFGAAADFHNEAISRPDTAEINYANAVEEWQTFLKKFPDDPLAPKAQHYLGVCQYHLGKYDAAIAAFEAVAAKYPDFEMAATNFYNLGMARKEQGLKADDKALLTKAQEAFATVVKDYPKSSDAAESQFQVGEMFYQLDKNKEAAVAYRAALELFGPKAQRRGTVLYNLGFVEEDTDAAAASKTYDLFLTEYGQKKPAHPLLNEVYLRKGETLIKLKKYADAGPWLAAAARAEGFKHADRATEQQAFCKFNLKEFAEAAKLYAAVVAGWPQSEYANSSKLNAGKSYYWAEDYDAARKWLEQAVAAGGEFALSATHTLALACLKQQKPADALAAIDKILPQAADSDQLPDLLLARADALYELPDKRADSMAAYAKVANEHAASTVAPRAMYLAAFVAQEKGKYAEGLKYADAFLKSFADKQGGKQYVDDAKSIAASCHLLLEHYAAAQKLYEELLAAYPQDKNAERWNVQIGLCQYNEKKYEAAAKHLAPIVADLKDASLKAEANHLWGASLFNQEQYKQSLAPLEAAIAADAKWRDADRTLLLLALAQQRLGNTKAAMTNAARVIAEYPQSSELAQAHFRLGDSAYDAKDYKQAATEYKAVIDQFSDSAHSPFAYIGLGWTEIQQDKFAEAEKVFTDFLEKYKQHADAPEALRARSVAREKLEKYDLAIADADAFLASQPKPAESLRLNALMLKGRCAARSGKVADAVKAFDAVIAEAPADFAKDSALYELAWAHREAKQDAEALAVFQRLAKEYPKSEFAAEAMHHVGEHLYKKEKDYKKAATAYHDAMSKTEDKVLKEKAAHMLAWSYYMQDDFKNAEQTFAYQLSAAPGGDYATTASYMLAESQFKQGLDKAAEALASYEKALALKPKKSAELERALLHAGQAAAMLKKWDESIEYLKKLTTDHANAKSPFVPEALYEQARATYQLGESDAALAMFEDVITKAPRTVVGAKSRFMAGEIYFEKKDRKKAMAQFLRVVRRYEGAAGELDSWKANALYEYARCLEEETKDPKSAKPYYSELIEKFPNSDKVPLAKERIEAIGG